MFEKLSFRPSRLQKRGGFFFLILIFVTGFFYSISDVYRHAGLLIAQNITERRTLLRNTLIAKASSLHVTIQLDPIPETDLSILERHGALPEVFVDQDPGTIFPLPLAPPNAASWSRLLPNLLRISRLQNRSLRRANKIHSRTQLLFESGQFRFLDQRLSQAFTWIRYLENWTPKLLALKHPKNWDNLHERIRKATPAELAALQKAFRPKRWVTPPYLPPSLEAYRGRTLPIVIATDITSSQIRAELEGAVETFWNDSPWAREQGIRFRIEWETVQPEKFPKDHPVLTTGGLSTQVRGWTLRLAPGKITPRTLAHEFGHLLGFPDCYSRTLRRSLLHGIEILEWDNPFYPDDLMCDNQVGTARAEVW